MNQAMKIRVMVVDDDVYVREGIHAVLGRSGHVEVVAEAAGTAEALAGVRAARPDVVVVALAGIHGLHVTRDLRDCFPSLRVLIMAGNRGRDMLQDVVHSGARGCVNRTAPVSELVTAIERVHREGTFVTADMAKAFFDQFVAGGGRLAATRSAALSPRERQVLGLIVEGLPNKDMAVRLSLSVRTVEKHRQRVMRKFGVRRATELVKVAAERGWIQAARIH